jgi:hypothetical protein
MLFGLYCLIFKYFLWKYLIYVYFIKLFYNIYTHYTSQQTYHIRYPILEKKNTIFIIDECFPAIFLSSVIYSCFHIFFSHIYENIEYIDFTPNYGF